MYEHMDDPELGWALSFSMHMSESIFYFGMTFEKFEMSLCNLN
jgi:hypothetical protein